jgi:hypothetical protein
MEQQQQPNTQLVRMITGEDVIAQVETKEENGKNYLVLKAPMRVLYTMYNGDPNTMQVGLIEWVLPSICDTDSYMVRESDVLMRANTHPNLNRYYHKMTAPAPVQQWPEGMDEKMMKDIMQAMEDSDGKTYH